MLKSFHMLLESLEVHNFRNLSGKVVWGAGLNIIYGDNGQGKTNWLEAIYLLATTKSFRTQRLQETIRFEEDLAVVRGRVAQSSEVHREMQVNLQRHYEINFSQRQTRACDALSWATSRHCFHSRRT